MHYDGSFCVREGSYNARVKDDPGLYLISHFRVPLMPLYLNEVRCSAFDTEMIFHSHANKIHFHKKGCALDLILKVRVFGTRKWPISFVNFEAHLSVSVENVLYK